MASSYPTATTTSTGWSPAWSARVPRSAAVAPASTRVASATTSWSMAPGAPRWGAHRLDARGRADHHLLTAAGHTGGDLLHDSLLGGPDLPGLGRGALLTGLAKLLGVGGLAHLDRVLLLGRCAPRPGSGLRPGAVARRGGRRLGFLTSAHEDADAQQHHGCQARADRHIDEREAVLEHTDDEGHRRDDDENETEDDHRLPPLVLLAARTVHP